jgi:hypothetical protein
MARFVWIAAIALAACTGKDPYNPGDPIGAFHVSAQLVSTTCGSTPNPWEFDVKLRHNLTTLYWVQGGAPVSGELSGASTTMNASTSQTMIDANPKTQTPACVVTRKDTVVVALDTTDASAVQAFSGSIAYHFDAQDGSDCTAEITANGGDFDALPCDVSYTLAAKRTGDLAK